MTPKKLGRPPLAEKRETIRNIRFTTSEDAVVREAAEAAGEQVAAWIRKVAVTAAHASLGRVEK